MSKDTPAHDAATSERLISTTDTYTTPDYDPWGTFNRYVIDDKPCVVPGINDGIINRDTGEVKAYPCHRSYCPRHWRNYARLKAPDLINNLPRKAYWEHFRLTCPVRLKPRTRQPNIKRWVGDMMKTYPGCHVTTFAHRGKNHDHYHALVGHDEPIDPEQGRDLWKLHRPGKKTFPKWSSSWWACPGWKYAPANFVWYCFLGKKDKPRREPPWEGLPMKYPYRQYGTIKTTSPVHRYSHELQRLDHRLTCHGLDNGRGLPDFSVCPTAA